LTWYSFVYDKTESKKPLNFPFFGAREIEVNVRHGNYSLNAIARATGAREIEVISEP